MPFRNRLTQLIEHIANTLQLRRIAVHKVFQHIEAVAIGQHQTIRRLAITPCATDFLAVVFNRLGQVEMHHIADIAFINAHPEGDGGNDAVQLPAHELALDALALLMGQTGVVSVGADAVLVEVFGNLLGGPLQRDIDDARLADARAHPLHQALALGCTADRLDPQVKIGAIETGSDDIRLGNGEFGLHIRNDIGRGSRRQQQGLRDIELTLVVGELQIVRAEVMPPLGNTVRFVHHQQGNRYLLQKVTEALVFQALDRDHQDLQFARFGPGHDVAGVLTALRRIDAGRGNAVALQKRQLVLHQGQ